MFRVRTITVFVSLRSSDFSSSSSSSASSDKLLEEETQQEQQCPPHTVLQQRIERCSIVLKTVEKAVVSAGYEVQTLRLATNPFGEWIYHADEMDDSEYDILDKDGEAKKKHSLESNNDRPAIAKAAMNRLRILDLLLEKYEISFCSLGPATTAEEAIAICPTIILASPRFSCSVNVPPADIQRAKAAAECILTISKLGESAEKEASLPHVAGGLGNFRFCAAASCVPFIPFFPAAYATSDLPETAFTLGLENGSMAHYLLSKAESISYLNTIFRDGMTAALLPLQNVCEKAASATIPVAQYMGIDSSLNPSLEDGGSVAEAIETLREVNGSFGGPGTLAATASITTALQSLPGIKLTGYCGLMLPVCEDQRLAQLASSYRLNITQLLTISSVCGVGVDTVPIPSDCTNEDLALLILDVAGLAGRWNKSLTCRVFPVPRLGSGETTSFDSPYLINCRVFSLE